MTGPRVLSQAERFYKRLIPQTWDFRPDDSEPGIEGFDFESPSKLIQIYVPNNLEGDNLIAMVNLRSKRMSFKHRISEVYEILEESKERVKKFNELGYYSDRFEFVHERGEDFLEVTYYTNATDKVGMEKIISDVVSLDS